MKNLFVGNLSFQTTESDLTALFKGFGEVTRVHVAKDRETGRARGFAFVEMPNDEEAAKAIAGLEWERVWWPGLKVNEARPRAERPPAQRRWWRRAKTRQILQRRLPRIRTPAP